MSSLDAEEKTAKEEVLYLRQKGYAKSLARNAPAAFLGSGSPENYKRMQRYKRSRQDEFVEWRRTKELAENRLNGIAKRRVQLESELRDLRREFSKRAVIEEAELKL